MAYLAIKNKNEPFASTDGLYLLLCKSTWWWQLQLMGLAGNDGMDGSLEEGFELC